MRLNSTLLFLIAGVLLLAKSDSGPALILEVHSANAPIEVTGSDVDQVTVDESSNATVINRDGRTLVEGAVEGGRIRIQAPRRVSLSIVTSNGEIQVSGVVGPLDLITSNGPIVVTSGGGTPIHSRTSNGSIEILAPRGINANLSARTSNGQINCDFEVVAHHAAAKSLEGKIGIGGPVIDLSTSNGSIHLGTGADQETVMSTFKPAK
jgi:DUF4097 and DUF4098 domain-containing protein YvlB